MIYTYSQFKSKVSEIVQDDAAKLTTTERDNFIQESLKIYSRHRPREIVKDITGAGTYDYSIAANLAYWSDEFSSIKKIEYPADEREPVYLDDDDYMIIRKEDGLYLRFLNDTPPATEKIRVTYTGLHILNDVLIEDCEDAWNEQIVAGVTSEIDLVDFKTGLNSEKLTMADGAAVGILASEMIGVDSLRDCTHLFAWFKSSIALNANDLQFLLSDEALCANPIETLAVVALTANAWTLVQLALANPALDLGLISIGINQRVDKGAFILRIDDVRAVQNTVPQIHEDALCNLAASLCSGALASAYAQTSDSTITADSVDHMSKSREYAARAKVQKQNYLDQIGIKEGEVPPASVIKDIKTNYPGGSDRLTHPKRWR